MNVSQRQIYNTVREMAAQEPNIALSAVLAGYAKKMDDLRERVSEKDAAFLCALSLAQTSRLTKETRQQLNERIARSINPNNTCETEKRVLDAVKEGVTLHSTGVGS